MGLSIKCRHCGYPANLERQDGKVVRVSCATSGCRHSVNGNEAISKMFKEIVREKPYNIRRMEIDMGRDNSKCPGKEETAGELQPLP